MIQSYEQINYVLEKKKKLCKLHLPWKIMVFDNHLMKENRIYSDNS